MWRKKLSVCHQHFFSTPLKCHWSVETFFFRFKTWIYWKNFPIGMFYIISVNASFLSLSIDLGKHEQNWFVRRCLVVKNEWKSFHRFHTNFFSEYLKYIWMTWTTSWNQCSKSERLLPHEKDHVWLYSDTFFS